MRILFINPANCPPTNSAILIEPIDLLNLASYCCNKGHEVKLIDMDAEKRSNQQLIKILDSFKPNLIIILADYHIPLFNDKSLGELIDLIKIINNLTIPVILGGKLATYNPQFFLDKKIELVLARYELEPILDQLLIGEINNLSRLSSVNNIVIIVNNQVIETKKQKLCFDLKLQVKTNRSLINTKQYIDVRTILSSRGCSGSCKFCHVPNFWGKWRGLSAKQVITEIVHLIDNCKAKKILFLDDNALVDRQRMLDICQGLIDKKIKIKLGCLARVDQVDELLLNMMSKAGFRWIHYGIESGSEGVLKAMGKQLSIEHVIEIVKNSQKKNFRVRTSWIIDLPDMQEEDLLKTFNLIEQLHTEEIRLHFFTPRYGSQLYQHHFKQMTTNQYIHSQEPNLNLTQYSNQFLTSKLELLLKNLKKNHYYVIKNIEDTKNILDQNAKKIVSLCPLRYGLFW